MASDSRGTFASLALALSSPDLGVELNSRTSRLLKYIVQLLDRADGTDFRYQEDFRHSGALSRVVHILSTMLDAEEEKVNELFLTCLSNAVNVLVSAACHPTNNTNKVFICTILTEKILKFVVRWISSESKPVPFERALKEVLFLSREIISESYDAQLIFLEYHGLEILKRAVEIEDLMESSMTIKFGQRRPLFYDYCPTLFSSLISLLDAVITHNEKGSKVAEQLCIDTLLIRYIYIVPKDEQTFILMSSLAHLIENGCRITLKPFLARDLLNMGRAVQDTRIKRCFSPIIEYLEAHVDSNHQATSKRKATPHPKQLAPKKVCLSSDVTGDVDHFHDLMEPNSCEILNDSCDSNQLTGSEVSLRSTAQSTAQTKAFLVNSAPVFCTHFISIAELIVFMQCISINGVNMKAIRQAFPFHPHLTPDDLYALWRAVWNKI